MIAEERKEFILSQLRAHGFIRTAELAENAGVTEMTIRRDLQALEREGHLVRSHGGARLADGTLLVSMQDEKNMRDRTEHQEEKTAVARYAASLVKDGENIYLDGGTSILAMAPYLSGKRLRIVTHSLLLANVFTDENAELYLLGGRYIPKYGMCVGPMVTKELTNFQFDHAFIGCIGVDAAEEAFYTAELDTKLVKEAAIAVSQKKHLLIDSSKLAIRGFYRSVSTQIFDDVICNAPQGTATEKMPANFIFV